MRPAFLVFSLISVLPLAACQGGGGNWTPVDNPNDPFIHKIAAFGVSEYNKIQGERLAILRIVSAEWKRVDEGIGYRVVFDGRTPALPSAIYETAVTDSVNDGLKYIYLYKQS